MHEPRFRNILASLVYAISLDAAPHHDDAEQRVK